MVIINRFEAVIAKLAWSIQPYEVHVPSVNEQGEACVICYVGKVYQWNGWYIVIAQDRWQRPSK